MLHKAHPESAPPANKDGKDSKQTVHSRNIFEANFLKELCSDTTTVTRDSSPRINFAATTLSRTSSPRVNFPAAPTPRESSPRATGGPTTISRDSSPRGNFNQITLPRESSPRGNFVARGNSYSPRKPNSPVIASSGLPSQYSPMAVSSNNTISQRLINDKNIVQNDHHSNGTLSDRYQGGFATKHSVPGSPIGQSNEKLSDVSDKKPNTQIIPKLRFKGAMFSGNISTEGANTLCEQPLDLSRMDQIAEKSSKSHNTHKRNMNVTKEEVPLDLSVKKAKRTDGDDDVVFISEQKASMPAPPIYNSYNRHWRPALQQKLKQRKEKAEQGFYQSSVVPTNVSSGTISQQHKSNNHVHSSSYNFNTYSGSVTPPQNMVPQSARPKSTRDGRNVSSNSRPSMGLGQSNSNQFPPGYPYTHTSHIQAVPAQGLLTEMKDVNMNSSQSYSYPATQERTFSHPSQINSAHNNTRAYCGVASMSPRSKHELYDSRAANRTPVSAHQSHYSPRSATRPSSLPVNHNKSTNMRPSSNMQGFSLAQDWNSIPPVAHSKKPFSAHMPRSSGSITYTQNSMPSLIIDIPTTSTGNNVNAKGKQPPTSYSIALENVLGNNTPHHSYQQLPKAQNSRSIMAGTSGFNAAKRRQSESSPPELSIATSMSIQNKMTCPSPLPSPQMPILSPQKAVPPEGSPFASQATRTSSERFYCQSSATSMDATRSGSTKTAMYRSSKYNFSDNSRKVPQTAGLEDKFRIHRGNPEVRSSDPVPFPSSRVPLAHSNQLSVKSRQHFSGMGHDDQGSQSSLNMYSHRDHSSASVPGQQQSRQLIPLPDKDVANGASKPHPAFSRHQTFFEHFYRIDQCGLHQRSAKQQQEKEPGEITRDVPDNLAAFVPTSERYVPSPLVMSPASMHCTEKSGGVSSLGQHWSVPVSLETVTRTISVTSTTCSTRIVPVANVNPMIQGKAAVSVPNRPTVSKSTNSNIPAVPACGFLKDWTPDVASYKKNSLRIPSKLITVPSPSTVDRSTDKVKNTIEIDDSPSVSTTTVTTRPTPVSLPSRASTEGPHVSTQPVTPIKRDPDSDKCFTEALIQNSTNTPIPSVEDANHPSTHNSPIPPEVGFISQNFRRHRKLKKNVVKDRRTPDSREMPVNYTKSFGNKTSTLLEHMLTPKPTPLSGNNDVNSTDSGVPTPVTIARVETECDPILLKLDQNECSMKSQTKDVTKMSRTKHSNIKKLTPLMRKVSKQLAHEMGKQAFKRHQKIYEKSRQLKKETEHNDKPHVAKDLCNEKLQPVKKSPDLEDTVPRLSPVSPRERLKILKIRQKSKTPSPKGKISPKASGQLSPRLPQRLAMRSSELLRQREQIIRNLDFEDTAESDSASSQYVAIGSKDSNHQCSRGRHLMRRVSRMLGELENSEGYVGDKRERDSSGDLFADPSQLTREERALQKAMLRFTEMEQREKAFGCRRRQTAAVAKANQLKKRALKTSMNSPSKYADVKSSPESQKSALHSLTHTRTRSQEAALHGWRRSLSYHKDDRYELALQRDEERRRIRRRLYKRRRLHSPRSWDGSFSSPDKYSPEKSDGLSSETSPNSSTVTPEIKQEKPSPESEELLDTSFPTVVDLSALELAGETQEWQTVTPSKKKRKYHWRRKCDGFPKPKYKSKSPKRGRGRGRGRRGRHGLHRWSGMEHSGDLQIYQAEVMELQEGDYPITSYGEEGVSEDFPVHPDEIKLEPLDDGYDTGYQQSPNCKPGAVGRPLPPMLKKLNIYRDTGETVLHRAARLGYEDVALYCAETKYVDVNARDNAGFTPLHECCASGKVTIAKYLLAHGADVNVSSKVDGIRPIHDAVENDNVEMVRLLLSCGADPNLATYSGRNAVKLAKSDSMKQFLRGFFVDIHGEDVGNNHWSYMNLRPGQGTRSISGFNLFGNLPPDDDSDENMFLFDLSDTPHLTTYHMTLDDALRPSNYLLLPDVLDHLKMTRDEFINIHGNVKFVSITWKDLHERLGTNVIKTSDEEKGAQYNDSYVEVLELDKPLRNIMGLESLCSNDSDEAADDSDHEKGDHDDSLTDEFTENNDNEYSYTEHTELKNGDTENQQSSNSFCLTQELNSEVQFWHNLISQ